MMTKPSESSSLERMDLVHIAVGGIIAFGVVVLLIDIVQNGFLQILFNLNIGGIIFFMDFYQIARDLFVFGLVFLTSGFCGGIYTGYNLYPNLKKVLFIPAVISTVGVFLLITVINGYYISSEFIGLMLLLLAGNTIGSYLGGYAINWGEIHGESEASGKFTLKTR
jgi:hypothetical protein